MISGYKVCCEGTKGMSYHYPGCERDLVLFFWGRKLGSKDCKSLKKKHLSIVQPSYPFHLLITDSDHIVIMTLNSIPFMN